MIMVQLQKCFALYRLLSWFHQVTTVSRRLTYQTEILVNKTDRALYLLINKAYNTTTQYGNHSLLFVSKDIKCTVNPANEPEALRTSP